MFAQTMMRTSRLAAALLILSVVFVILSPTNLRAQAKESDTTPRISSNVEILTPTGGVDFRDYMSHLIVNVKRNWYAVMPEDAQLGDKGRVVVRFQIQKDGTLLVKDPTVEAGAKNRSLDKAAVSAIRSSAPFQHLPTEFSGPYIDLRFVFLYNLPLESARVLSDEPASTGALATVRDGQPPFDKLELFGFFAALPNGSYALQVIQSRGTSFTPDESFISSFSNSAIQRIARGIKPREVSTTSPGHDAAYDLLRSAWNARGSRQMAAEGYQRALQLAPDSATLHLAYAASLLVSRDFPAAEAQARQSLKLWPNDAEAHTSLALSLTAQRQFVEGESESREALRIFPELHGAMFALGVSLTHESKYQEAVPVLQKLIEALPNMSEVRKLLGISLFETGQVGEGADQLSAYVKNVPEDAEGHYYLGAVLRSKSRTEEARAEFAEAFRLKPDNAQYEAAAHPDVTQGARDEASGPKPEDGDITGNVYENRFFSFTYEFPKGWVNLGPDAGRRLWDLSGVLFSTGDPTEIDVRKAAEQVGHRLLYLAESGAGNQPVLIKSVIVAAIDLSATPEQTPESFLKFLGERFKRTKLRLELNEMPEEINIGGRSFWKATFAGQTGLWSLYTTQFVTKVQGYLLTFAVSVPDPVSLHEIEKSLNSIHFTASRNGTSHGCPC